MKSASQTSVRPGPIANPSASHGLVMGAWTRVAARNFVWGGLLVAMAWCFAVVTRAETPPDRAAVAESSVAVSGALTAAQLADGWISLFDGHSLYGWRAETNANFRVVAGTIVADAGNVGLLRTTSQFSDFELHVEFQATAQTNSGVFLRTPPTPRNPATDCYEINIAPTDNPYPTGGIVKRIKAQTPDTADAIEEDAWRSFDITVQGPVVEVRLDGNIVATVTDDQRLGRGYIGLQFREGRIAFRNIRLRPLGTESLFNEKDLSGWKEYPEMASRFYVKTVDGRPALHVDSGRGQLESNERFGDFVLQLECKTHAPKLNSGVFFRCIPGEPMMGYECQIQNGYHEADRSRPEDCGTGGFFRRKNARRIVADDETWFHLTLIAEGPHMAAWVNGEQVSDWSDTRKAHENPRKGLRLAPGSLILQGHDPTTNISFRHLRAVEMAPRRP